MPERQCPVCGRRFVPKTGAHRYCTPVCRAVGQASEPTHGQKYGYEHRKLRARVARQVEAGAALCSRCFKPIVPGSAWDLDHADGGGGYLGPAHASCNRAAGADSGRAAVAPESDETYEDDPARGIFWGPPGLLGKPVPWSRVWYDWRAEA